MDEILQENGDFLLQENGDTILLEQQPVTDLSIPLDGTIGNVLGVKII